MLKLVWTVDLETTRAYKHFFSVTIELEVSLLQGGPIDFSVDES